MHPFLLRPLALATDSGGTIVYLAAGWALELHRVRGVLFAAWTLWGKEVAELDVGDA